MRATPGSWCLTCFNFDLYKTWEGALMPRCLDAGERVVTISGACSDETVIRCSAYKQDDKKVDPFTADLLPHPPKKPQPSRAGKKRRTDARAGKRHNPRRK